MGWNPKKSLDKVVSGGKKAAGQVAEGVRTGDINKVGEGVSTAWKSSAEGQIATQAQKEGQAAAKKLGQAFDTSIDVDSKVESGAYEKSSELAKQLKAQREAATGGRKGSAAGGVGEAGVVEAKRSDVRDVVAGKSGQMTAERIFRGNIRDVEGGSIAESNLRGAQTGLIDQLQAQSRGEGPSLAEMQAKRQGDRALAQQMAMASGATGSGAALARRTAARQQAGIAQDIAATSAMARLQEQQQAQQLLGSVAGQARGQDLQRNTQQAMMQQQAQLANQGIDMQVEAQNAAAGNAAALANLKATTADADRALKADLANQGVDLDLVKTNAAAGNAAELANLQAALTKAGMDDAMQIAYMQNELGMTQLEAQAALAGAEIESREAIASKQVEAQTKSAEAAAKAGMVAGALSAAGTLGAAALSDINLKKDIKKRDISKITGDRLTDFLNSLETYDYKYKDEKYGKGDQTSVMAQDLLKSDIGSKAVQETDEGLMVNYSKLLPELLAATVETHKKVNKLEEVLAKRSKMKGK